MTGTPAAVSLAQRVASLCFDATHDSGRPLLNPVRPPGAPHRKQLNGSRSRHGARRPRGNGHGIVYRRVAAAPPASGAALRPRAERPRLGDTTRHPDQDQSMSLARSSTSMAELRGARAAHRPGTRSTRTDPQTLGAP